MNLLLSKTYFTLGIKNQHCQNKYISRQLLDCQVTIVSISGVRGEMFSGLWGKFLFLLNNFLSKQNVGNLYISICLTERIFTLTGNYCSSKKNICQDQKQSFTQMAIILLSTFSLPLVQLLNLQSVSMRHGMVVAMNICSCSSKFEYRVQVWVGLKAEKGDRRSRITLSLSHHITGAPRWLPRCHAASAVFGGFDSLLSSPPPSMKHHKREDKKKCASRTLVSPHNSVSLDSVYEWMTND